jgi:hypothetical protein
MQNNSKLAEIAYTALQQQLELSLSGFQYKNSLLESQLAQKQATEDRYYNRYQDVIAQMNQENAMAEQVRQYNESLALEKSQFAEQMKFDREQLAEQIRQYDQSYALQMKEFNESIRQFDIEMARLKAQDKAENAYKIRQLQLQKQQLEQEQSQWEREYQLKARQLKEQQRQFDKTYSSTSGIDKGSTEIPSFSSYEDAAAYMKKQGVATGDGGLMTKNEWLRRKSSGSTSGAFSVDTYNEYLNEYVKWRIDNPQ